MEGVCEEESLGLSTGDEPKMDDRRSFRCPQIYEAPIKELRNAELLNVERQRKTVLVIRKD